jgi:hypothetical protein
MAIVEQWTQARDDEAGKRAKSEMQNNLLELKATAEKFPGPTRRMRVHSINPPSPCRNGNSPIVSGATEDNPQGHPPPRQSPLSAIVSIF